jgi:hypothetical protein
MMDESEYKELREKCEARHREMQEQTDNWRATTQAAIDQVWRMMNGTEPPVAAPVEVKKSRDTDIVAEIGAALTPDMQPGAIRRPIESVSAKRRREIQDMASTIKDLGAI